jgi:hypothetical protein
MNVQTIFETHGELWSTVEYTENGWLFHDRNPSDRRRGVYAFVSEYGIEKVGKIENANGVAARTYQYQSSKSRINNGRYADASDLLWDDVMTNDEQLVGQTLLFFFIPLDTVTATVCGVEVETAPIRPLELQLSKMARDEANPMRLSGKGN